MKDKDPEPPEVKTIAHYPFGTPSKYDKYFKLVFIIPLVLMVVKVIISCL